MAAIVPDRLLSHTPNCVRRKTCRILYSPACEQTVAKLRRANCDLRLKRGGAFLKRAGCHWPHVQEDLCPVI